MEQPPWPLKSNTLPTSPAPKAAGFYILIMLLSATLLVLASYAHRNNLFTLSLSVPSASPGSIVDVGYAKYLGNLSYPNTVAYLGIPYAEPPVGCRRFRAPLPLNTTRVSLEAKGAVVDASEYSDFCIQGTTRGKRKSEFLIRLTYS